jgi:hypothetical protein
MSDTTEVYIIIIITVVTFNNYFLLFVRRDRAHNLIFSCMASCIDQIFTIPSRRH